MLRQLSFPMIQDFLSRHTTGLPVLALLLATFFWGSSFITVASALEYTNPLTLVMLRFALGAGTDRRDPASYLEGRGHLRSHHLPGVCLQRRRTYDA